MRRLSLLLILLVAVLVGLSASNAQKVWSTRDPIFGYIETLYILEGRALPSSTGPWSTAELDVMLSKVSRSTSPELYDHIARELGREGEVEVDETFSMSLDGTAAFTLYAHTDTEFSFPYDYVENYIFRTKYNKPTLDAGWETWVGENIYGYFI